VVRTGILPHINTGMAGKVAGVVRSAAHRPVESAGGAAPLLIR